MWKKVQINGAEFLMKHDISGTKHKVYVTNLVHLWLEEILEEILLQRCKELNKLVEASDEVFLGHVWSLVDSEDSCDIIRDLAPTDCGNTLTLQTSLQGFKFRIKFMLTAANHSQFYEEVTKPLLTMVCELDKRQQRLVDIIKTKDIEIEEYKLEGGQISRKAVQTEPFDLEAFSAKCQESISASKSLVAACPSYALTPHLQCLLDKIAAAPEEVIKENLDESKPNKSKKLVLTLKSPAKNKKKKLYEDDDGEDDSDDFNKIGNANCNKEEEIKVKQEHKRSSPVKPKQNHRLKKALSNL